MIVPRLEALLRKTANRFGLDIHRHRQSHGLGNLPLMLAQHHIDLVLDVGANIGQFATSMRIAGYRGRIVSFEPLSTAYDKLLVASENDPDWNVAPRMAIGDAKGRIELHVAGNSVSSSTLAMLSSHTEAAPGSTYVTSETVELTTLESLAPKLIRDPSRTFLKIDTQGSEDRVLDGAGEQLHRFRGLRLELSLLPLYEGQQLFDQLDARLIQSGFNRWAIDPVFSDTRTGRMLQVDCTYFRD